MNGWNRKTLVSAIVLAVFLLLPAGCRTFAATQDITYSITYAQTSARSITSMVNALRTGGSWYWNPDNETTTTVSSLSALTYDYDLEKSAMQRAAELAIYYSHTRPNGSICYTALSRYNSCGENIAAGYETAADVYNGWLEEYDSYEGQGHRRNMLGSSYTAIGIGHVICNGTHYWAMELRSPVVSTTQTDAKNGVESITVPVDTGNLDKVTVSVSSPYQIIIGEEYTLSPQCLLQAVQVNGWICKVPVSGSFTVSVDSDCLHVNGTRLTAVKEGTANVTVQGVSDYGTASTSFTMKVDRIDLAYAEIYLAQTEYSYTGSAICPKPVITYQGRTLVEDTDYELVYARNEKCTRNTGGANVMAVGIGKYKGNLAERFEILAADISGMTASLSQTVYTYDGYTKEPDVVITGLEKDTDFRVTYENNRSVGKAKAIVTGTGNYKGTITLLFTINSSSNASSSDAENDGSSASQTSLQRPVIKSAKNVKTRKIKVTWEKQNNVSGYELRLQTGKTVKTVTIKKAGTVKKTVSKLKKGKTYKVSIRSYKILNGKVYYSAWSKKKKVKVKK